MTLIPEEDLARAQARYLAQHAPQTRPKTKTRAEILVEVATEDPTITVAQLAQAAERSPSWVRRTLKSAGVKLATQRQKKAEVQPRD